MRDNPTFLKIIPICFSALITFVLYPIQAPAEILLGNYNDWDAFTEKENGSLVCYMGAVPKKSSGKYKKRGQTFLLITHRPRENSANVVSLRPGYTYKRGSTVEMVIGKSTFKLFTVKKWAVAENANIDKNLVQAMIQGRSLTVVGISTRGTRTTDTYSLRGFTAAYKAIGKACKI